MPGWLQLNLIAAVRAMQPCCRSKGNIYFAEEVLAALSGMEHVAMPVECVSYKRMRTVPLTLLRV
jgi:hypothetical protein